MTSQTDSHILVSKVVRTSLKIEGTFSLRKTFKHSVAITHLEPKYGNISIETESWKQE